MEGCNNLVGMCAFANILTFAFALSFDYAAIKTPRLMPLYPKGWALKLAWKFL
jgi:hypothetical protein